jgi:CHAD domain-containing protein
MRQFVQSETAALLEKFSAKLEAAADSTDAHAIHDLRVSIRRLSRCLRVFSDYYPGRSWKKVRKQLSKLMDYAGAARDCDIAIELLAEAKVPESSPLIATLQKRRQEAGEDLQKASRRWNHSDIAKKWHKKLDL